MILKENLDERYKSILEHDEVIEKVKKENKKYYEATPSSILFRSDSLFTDKFLNELNSILREKPNSGKEFRKRSAAEKRKISQSLLEVESH